MGRVSQLLMLTSASESPGTQLGYPLGFLQCPMGAPEALPGFGFSLLRALSPCALDIPPYWPFKCACQIKCLLWKI